MGLPKIPLTSDRPLYDDFYDGYRLFIGDLSEYVLSSDVDREFCRFGGLIDVWVARNPPGFGFVVFKNKVDCERCRRKLNGKALFDRPLRVEFATPFPIKNDGRAPASYQAYIAKLRERGIEPKFHGSWRPRTPARYRREITTPIVQSSHRRYFRDGSEEYQSEHRHVEKPSRHKPSSNHHRHRDETDSESEARLIERQEREIERRRVNNKRVPEPPKERREEPVIRKRKQVSVAKREDEVELKSKIVRPATPPIIENRDIASPSCSGSSSGSGSESSYTSESDSGSESCSDESSE